MKKTIVRIIKKTIGYINTALHKKHNRIYFSSIPDYTGNSKAMSDYFTREHPGKYELVWSVYDPKAINKSNNIIIIKKGTIKSFFYFFTSKYIISTHNEMVGIAGKNQKYISLWHGMPFKKICYLGKTDYIGMENYSAKRIATSEITRSIISASFCEKANNVYITGQPRNDFLFEPYDISKLIPNINKEEKKIILYIPTFRENKKNTNYSDGSCLNEDNFLRVNDFDINRLDDFLEKNDSILILKLHPYEEEHFCGREKLSKNIYILNSQLINSVNIDINQILPQCNYLITDYSSIYLDFLILNKPIIFLVPDIKEYIISRGGFTLEPYDFWMPGYHIGSQNELLSTLRTIFSHKDEFIEQRQLVNNIINTYKDNKNSERVYNELF